MRLKLFGDHSTFHCGSQAVVDVLRSQYRQHCWVGADDPDYDALIVNGEGTLHHSASSHRPAAIEKMNALRLAIDQGKPAALVNTVWQDMVHDFDDMLPSLAFISAREKLSAAELLERHGVSALVCPDLSYFHPIDEDGEAPDWSGQNVVTDFYSKDFQAWVRPTSGKLFGMTYVDMRSLSWSQLVRGLRSARLLVSGRHHAIYAAAKAGIPFVAVTSNSHKIEGLIQSSGAGITVHKRLPNPKKAVALALDGEADQYEKLYSWMRLQSLQLPKF